MTGQININKEIRKRKFGWIGHTLRKDDSKPCKAALRWNPQGTRGQEIHGDELAGVISGLSPGAEKDEEDL
jgi:hypothetical protein